MTEQEKYEAEVRSVADMAITALPDDPLKAYAAMTTLGRYMAHDIISGVHDENTVVYAREFYRVHSAVRLIATLTEMVES